jgi:hypothetical protein
MTATDVVRLMAASDVVGFLGLERLADNESVANVANLVARLDDRHALAGVVDVACQMMAAASALLDATQR